MLMIKAWKREISMTLENEIQFLGNKPEFRL